jgi:hypothetical protein
MDHRRRSGQPFVRAGAFAVGMAVTAGAPVFTGCVGEELMEPEAVESTAQGISTNDYQDGTGTILIRVKTCDWTATATSNCSYCFVDDGWARIGGGAEIESEATPGAALTESLPYRGELTEVNSGGCTGGAGPNDFNSVWMARSTGPAHRLRTYIVGLQLRNSPTDPPFKPYASSAVDTVTGALDPPSTFSVDCSEADLFSAVGRNDLWLIGGGAQIQPNGFPTYSLGDARLTGSYPRKAGDGYTTVWRATARFQQAVTSGVSLKCWGIGVEYCPAGWNYCFTHPSIRSVTGASTSGYRTVTDTTPASWVPTVVGGRAAFGSTGFGRYLADLVPLNGSSKGFTVRSKPSNSGTPSSGETYGYSLSLGRADANYTYNAIRFNTAGTALYRPSGTAPVSLRWSSAFPDDAQHRWHLETFGTNGEYRVRNGNPDSGTECARRSGSNVQIAACGTGTDFRWTLVSDNGGSVFKLRNVAAGQCMDNTGTQPPNIVLKNCASGYAAAQSLFLDKYSWPPQ